MEASDPLFRHQPDYGLPAVAPTHRVLERRVRKGPVGVSVLMMMLRSRAFAIFRSV